MATNETLPANNDELQPEASSLAENQTDISADDVSLAGVEATVEPTPDSDTPDSANEAEPEISEAEPAAPARTRTHKSPTSRIAVLASVCLVVLGFSVWGLVSAMGQSIAAEDIQEQASDTSAVAEPEAGVGVAEDAASTETAALESEDTAAATAEQAASTTTTTETITDNSTPTSDGSGSQASTPAASQPSAPQAINVTLSVDCYAAVEAGSTTAMALSDNGDMRFAAIRLNAGATVYDALVASQASLNTSRNAMGVYIISIDGLSQGEAGPTSGWTYLVNGVSATQSCDRYVLSNGDYIEWRYVTSA